MRICIVVETFPAVSETFIINKVLSLIALGHKVQVVCFKKTNEASVIFSTHNLSKNNITINKINFSTNLLSILRNFAISPSLFFKSISFSYETFKRKYKYNYLTWFINKIKYDVIHFEFSGLGIFFLPVIDRLKGAKTVSCRGTAENVKLLDDTERQKSLSKLFKKVDLIHCVSEKMKETVEPFCRDKNKLFVNTPAVDTSIFKPTTNKNENQIFTIVSVGRLSFVKGHLIGLLAIKHLVQQGFNVVWKVVGDGPELEQIQFHIHTLGIEKNVQLLGKRTHDEVNETLNSANALILTSYSEGIPNVVLEAMSKEIPVVTTNCGGVSEVIENGKDGFIVDLYAHEAMAEKIAILMQNEILAKQIGKAARQKIIEKFSIENQAKTFYKFYSSVV
ncbi:MAG: glycosyltransferase family 4 protein [Bacteroidetes bacterium]|nr:glycosyltransferase family 4 protein [Bacteroidota bacterium]MBS1642991.1 glycosyltransferase family 4 protein [Bacteroidota bacterium]